MVAMFALLYLLEGCENRTKKIDDSVSNDNFHHGVMTFDTSSEADTRLMQSVRTIKGTFLKSELSGNADYDLLRLFEIYHNGVRGMASNALRSLKDEQLKISAVRIMESSVPESALKGSIFLEKSTINFNPENKKNGLGKEISEFKDLIRTDALLPSSFDHQFAALMIIHLKNSIELLEIIQQYSHNDEFRNFATRSITGLLNEIKLLQILLARH